MIVRRWLKVCRDTTGSPTPKNENESTVNRRAVQGPSALDAFLQEFNTERPREALCPYRELHPECLEAADGIF
jgi:hypothetical protein